jgi:type II secretory pathway component PulF
MPIFAYKVQSADGKTAQGLVEAANSMEASRILHEKQLFIVSLTEKAKNPFGDSLFARVKHVGFGDIVNFTRQLATMIVAGLSLPEALNILRNQTTNAVFAKVLNTIEQQIVGGGNLANALSKYPQYFSPIYVALVRAGESSGNLDHVMTRLAETLEEQREFRSKVTGAMIYPIIIVIGMTVVVFIMMTVVVPKLTDMYKDFGIDLPMTTQILINTSQFFVHYWWAMILAIGGAVAVFLKWKKTPVGQFLVDSMILKLPLFGELQKKIILVNFTGTLAMLISSGIHILEGLRILKDSLDNVVFRIAIEEVAKKIEKGFPMGDTFAQYEVFPPIVSQMIKVGEETGKIDDTLTKLSAYFQSESEHLVKGLTTAIEPLIMVFLGLGVGFIVISVITPIYNLTSQFK